MTDPPPPTDAILDACSLVDAATRKDPVMWQTIARDTDMETLILGLIHVAKSAVSVADTLTGHPGAVLDHIRRCAVEDATP